MNNINPSIKTLSFSDVFKKNSVLSAGLGLIPIISAGTSVRNGLALSIILLILTLGTYTTSFALSRLIDIQKWNKGFRIALYALISSIFFIPAFFLDRFIFSTLRDTLGIYLYILVMDMIVIYQADDFSVKDQTILNPIFSSIVNTTSFTIVILVISFFRELLITGGVYGNIFWNFKVPGANWPFFGFISLGLLIALYQFIQYRIENPKPKEKRKAKMKHKTLEEEIIHREKSQKQVEANETIESKKSAPAAFLQAKKEAVRKQNMVAKNIDQTVITEEMIKNEELLMAQETLEVVLSKELLEEETGSKKEIFNVKDEVEEIEEEK